MGLLIGVWYPDVDAHRIHGGVSHSVCIVCHYHDGIPLAIKWIPYTMFMTELSGSRYQHHNTLVGKPFLFTISVNISNWDKQCLISQCSMLLHFKVLLALIQNIKHLINRFIDFIRMVLFWRNKKIKKNFPNTRTKLEILCFIAPMTRKKNRKKEQTENIILAWP